MTRIELETIIFAPASVCFDLSRSVDIHQVSTAATNEKAIAGRLTGLCEKGDTITWRAKHFGFYHHLTMHITEMTKPVYFEDRMLKGSFRSIRHQHYFEAKDGHTVMKDIFEYEVPGKFFGRVFDRLFLHRHMYNLLVTRNNILRELAEKEVM